MITRNPFFTAKLHVVRELRGDGGGAIKKDKVFYYLGLKASFTTLAIRRI